MNFFHIEGKGVESIQIDPVKVPIILIYKT